MELCNMIIGRIVSSTASRSCVKRNLVPVYIQTAACSYNKSSSNNRSEYYSDDDNDDDFTTRRPNNDGGRRDNNRNSFQSRDRFNNYEQRGGFRSQNYNDRSGGFRSQNYDDRSGGFGGQGLTNIKWENEALTPLIKNVYCQSEKLEDRSEEEVKKFRSEHNMTVTGRDVPKPIQEFTDYEFSPEVSVILQSKGFQAPTAIQAQGWPIALGGRDLVGIGQTGSGKTLGYILPAVAHIMKNKSEPTHGVAEPIGLVMAPTRELAQQINTVALEMKHRSLGIRTACLYGGASKVPQLSALNYNPSICIATPGRLLDFLEMGSLNLKRCSYLVLDEADRMLDMGFEPQIRKVVSQIRPDRQTLMWSATWPKEIRSLAHDFLDDYIQVKVGPTELTANADIEQKVIVTEQFEKDESFMKLMKDEIENNNESRILVFAETKRQVDVIEHRLRASRISSAAIHGNHSQGRRDSSLYKFRKGHVKVLIATDVASRGLDVDDITLVVNYDCPNNIESYVHRIGRTARAGKSGRAVTFFTEANTTLTKELIKVLEESKQEVEPKLSEMLRHESRGGNFNYKKKSFNSYNSRNKFNNNRNNRYSDYQ